MTNTQFSMEDLKKRIEESVIVNMGMLMPQETLSKLVSDAIDRFFTATETFKVTRTSDHGWNASRVPNVDCTIKCSTFEMMVWDTIFPIVKNHLSEFIKDTESELNKTLQETTAKLNEKLKTMTLQNAATMVPVMQEYRMMASLNDTMKLMMSNIHSTFVLNRLDTGMLRDPITRNSLNN